LKIVEIEVSLDGLSQSPCINHVGAGAAFGSKDKKYANNKLSRIALKYTEGWHVQ
jgi:hypothetical protein